MKVRLETEYVPSKRQYHLIGASRDSVKLPRRRWFDSYEDLTAAVISLNPGIEIV